ncbi:MAG: hypothetical protein RL172_969 [Bacteroidota bacterium]|jgi:aspartate/methionine/tyrosine aminotransferase
MKYIRMPIEAESPEERGYDTIKYNLSESSVTDLTLADIGLLNPGLQLAYTDHRGKLALRQLLAAQYPGTDVADVLLTCGAAAALFMINTLLLSANDHLVVVRPNYATNIEVPKAIGCAISYVDLLPATQWQLTAAAIEDALTPATKLISITSPHNPTGMVLDEAELLKIIALAEARNIYLLVDETYRDICFKTPYPLAATLSHKVISISSVSKAYGLPGIRMGWLITKDAGLYQQLLCAKEMIHITNSILDEEACCQFLQNGQAWQQRINQKAQHHLQLVQQWLQAEPRIQAVMPAGGVVCFAAIRQGLIKDLPAFYDTLLTTYGTLVGPGHWFDMPMNYMRIGFAWPDTASLQQGLLQISACLDECIK